MVRKTILAVLAALPMCAQPPAPPQTQPQAAPAQVPIGALNLQNASLTEVVDSLARTLKMNIYVDPALKGGVTLNTYGDPRAIDARNLLDQLLRINNAALVPEGDLYRVVPLNSINHQPLRPQRAATSNDIPEDDQPMLNMVFLKYVSVDELQKVLKEFIGENAVMYPYSPANLLFILDSRRNMRRTMDLIAQFDSDTFANQRVRLFEVKNSRPSDIVKDLENILKSISLDPKATTVHFLPVDRINTLIAVASNPGVFETIEQWLKKLDVPVQITPGGAMEMHVYRVKYGRADCLAIALGQLFGIPSGFGGGGYGSAAGGFGGYGAYGPPGPPQFSYGGGYGSAYGGYGPSAFGGFGNPGGYGNATGFSGAFGGAGSCGAAGFGGFGGGYGNSYSVGGAFGYPSFGGYSAQAPATANPIGATGQPLSNANPQTQTGVAGQPDQSRQPRIVPNPLDNALIIQADAQTLQSILKILKDLDMPPRQILLEAKIFEIDLTDDFSLGVTATMQSKTNAADRKWTFGLDAHSVGTFGVGTLVDSGRQLLLALSANENRTRVHVLSEPSLIATDSIPASINVGTQVPVTTGSTVIPSGGNTVTTQNISSQNTGVTLQVAARVNSSGIVTLIIGQQISGIDSNATTNSATPAFAQQVVQTQITMQDGDTIAIGGTIKDTVTDTLNGIPGLIRLPFIGGLFGSKVRNHQRSEMIMFMTPHVIYDETSLVEASDELKNRVKMLRRSIRGM